MSREHQNVHKESVGKFFFFWERIKVKAIPLVQEIILKEHWSRESR